MTGVGRGGSTKAPGSGGALLVHRLRQVHAAWSFAAIVHVGANQDGDLWIDLRNDDLSELRRAIAARASWLGGVDQRIAASSFVFAYAKTLVVPAMATLVASDTLPDLTAGNALLRFPSPDRGVLWLRSDRVTIAQAGLLGQTSDIRLVGTHEQLLDTMVREALDGHLSLLVRRLSTLYRISARLLRTNVAVIFCDQFARLQLHEEGLAARAIEDAHLFHALAGSRFADTGDLEVSRIEGVQQVHFERANCCLFRLIPGESMCDGCSFARSRPRRSA